MYIFSRFRDIVISHRLAIEWTGIVYCSSLGVVIETGILIKANVINLFKTCISLFGAVGYFHVKVLIKNEFQSVDVVYFKLRKQNRR